MHTQRQSCSLRGTHPCIRPRMSSFMHQQYYCVMQFIFLMKPDIDPHSISNNFMHFCGTVVIQFSIVAQFYYARISTVMTAWG